MKSFLLKPFLFLLFMVKALLLALLVVTCLGTACFLAVRDSAAVAYLYFDRVDEAESLDPTQSKYAKTQGDVLLRRTIPPQLDLAAAEYLKALRLAPNNVTHWRDWSEVMLRSGDRDLAAKALKMAEYLAPNDHLVLMEKANFLMGEGYMDEAVQYHRRVIELRPAFAPPIYSFYWGMGWDPIETAERLFANDPALLCRYWLHALEWLEPDGARELWDEINKTHGNVFDATSHKQYFDLLIANRNYEEAKKLWNVIVEKFYGDIPQESKKKYQSFWNGDFKYRYPVFEGGLEWRISKTLPAEARAVISFARGLSQNDCIWIHFSGKENISFSHVRHSFFVEPGKTYRLKYHVSSLDITTNNGPYVKVTVFADKPLVTKGEIVKNTGDWQHEDIFSVPESAHWAELSICRDPTSKLSDKIQGDVWFDDFTLDEFVAEPDGEESIQ